MTRPLTPVRSLATLTDAPENGVYLIRIDHNEAVHAHYREHGLIDGRLTVTAFYGAHSDERVYLGVYDEAVHVESLDDLEEGAIVSFGESTHPFFAFSKIDEDLYIDITDGSSRRLLSTEYLRAQFGTQAIKQIGKRSTAE